MNFINSGLTKDNNALYWYAFLTDTGDHDADVRMNELESCNGDDEIGVVNRAACTGCTD